VTVEPDLFALSLANDSVRRGARIKLATDEADLQLMSVHPKSGCFDAPLDSGSDACRKLVQQVPVLESWIDQQAGNGVAFALLGDFNRRFKPGEEFWVEIDDGEPENADLSRVNEGQTSSCWGGRFPEFIDHIVLDKQADDWKVAASYEQLVYDDSDAGFEAKLADHCPLAITVHMPSGGGAPPGPTPIPAPTLSLEGLEQRIRRIEQRLGLPPM